MIYVYLILLVVAIVGGVAVFLKVRKPQWLRMTGFGLFGVALLILLLIPILLRHPQ
jgi:protein-S-isoprenylcysteine O-methyltransferase Ste14